MYKAYVSELLGIDTEILEAITPLEKFSKNQEVVQLASMTNRPRCHLIFLED